jgi:hypothetical protein
MEWFGGGGGGCPCMVLMSDRIHQTSDSIKSDPNISNRTAKSEYTD